MSTINVLDAAGQPVAIQVPLAPGRANAASSDPAVLCVEDFALFTAILNSLVEPTAFQAASANVASAVILNAAARSVVTIQNVTEHITVAIGVGIDAVMNGAGSLILPPYQTITLRGAAASASIYAAALTDGTPLTVGTG